MLRGLFKKKKKPYILQGNEKGQYLPPDGLGLVLVHKRLHLTQLHLQKPGHKEWGHLCTQALPALHRPLYSFSPALPGSFWSPDHPEGPYLSDCTDKGTSAFSL